MIYIKMIGPFGPDVDPLVSKVDRYRYHDRTKYELF